MLSQDNEFDDIKFQHIRTEEVRVARMRARETWEWL